MEPVRGPVRKPRVAAALGEGAGAVFHLEKRSVSCDDTVILKDVTLSVNEGEKVALVGPSGAGKTTLLRTLYEEAQESASFIHQDFALVPLLSAFHNVYMGRLDRYSAWKNVATLVRPSSEDLGEVKEILTGLGMGGKMLTRAGELSGGEQQRVAVARALYRGSGVILGDEPVSSIDPMHADEVLKFLLDSASTIVASLHSVHLALVNFDRVVGMRDGRVAFDLPSDETTWELLSDLYRPT